MNPKVISKEGLQGSVQVQNWETLQGSEQAQNLENLQDDATAGVTWLLASLMAWNGVCFEVGELVGLQDNRKLVMSSLHLWGM